VPSIYFQVDSENRFKFATLDSLASGTHTSVDCMDCPIREPQPFDRGLFSHKFRGAGFRYELALSLSSDDIVSVVGPFPCGRMPDVVIARQGGLVGKLEEGESFFADNGYRGLDNITHTPCGNEFEDRALARQEVLNSKLKQFKVLDQPFRHDFSEHHTCFKATVAITQIGLSMGEIKLFKL
jgi:hypothetical protein